MSANWLRKLGRDTSWRFMFLTPTICTTYNDLPFMCERKKVNGVQKLVLNLYDKKKCVIHIVALDQALKHGVVLHKVCQAIEVNQSM